MSMTTPTPDRITALAVERYCNAPWLAPSDLHTIKVTGANNVTLELPCWLYCTNKESYFMYDKSETDALLTTVVIMGSLSLTAAIFLCFNTLYQHFWSDSAVQRKETHRLGSHLSRRGSVRQVGAEKSRSEKFWEKWDDFTGSFQDRPFTYDVPFCVTLGCILISLGQLVPHMTGKKHIACNLKEDTYVQDVPKTNQPNCAFWGFVLMMGIHVTFSYQSMLSASLWRSLYQPMGNKISIPRQYVHIAVWLWVSVWLIYVMATEAFGGDIVLGTCNTASSNANVLLVTLLIPTGIYSMVSLVFSIAVIYKLYTHLRFADMNTNKALTAFMRRFSIYSILCTVGAIAFCVSIASFYAVFDKTNDSVQEYVQCNVQKTDNPDLECKRGDVPSSVFFWMLPVIAFLLSFGALVLSFNEENIEKWKKTCCGAPGLNRFTSSSNLSHDDDDNHPPATSPISGEKRSTTAGTLRPSAHKMTSTSVEQGEAPIGMVNVRSLSPPTTLEAGSSTPISTDSGGMTTEMVEARVDLNSSNTTAKQVEGLPSREGITSDSELVTAEPPERRNTDEDILADAMAAEFMSHEEDDDREAGSSDDDDSEDALPLHNQISVPIVVSSDGTGYAGGAEPIIDEGDESGMDDYGATVVVKPDENDDFVDVRDQRGQSEAL